jgi:ketosteroid isomerase-like protein
MSDRYAELKELTTRFVDAFNRMDLEGVVAFFTEDAVYEDSRGGIHRGPDAIREAFRPLLTGAVGRIAFEDEDFFAEPATGKVLASWTLKMDAGGRRVGMRGLDVLHFRGDRISAKKAYCKAATAQLDEAGG